MKKLTGILTFLITFASAISVFGADGIIQNGRTLVPIRGVFESLGFSVDWDQATNKATISDASHQVSVIKGLNYFKADGKEIYPDVPQQIINGSFYLPLRAIGDAVGADTSWNSINRIAHISYNGKDVYVNCGGSEKAPQQTYTTPESGRQLIKGVSPALQYSIATYISRNEFEIDKDNLEFNINTDDIIKEFTFFENAAQNETEKTYVHKSLNAFLYYMAAQAYTLNIYKEVQVIISKESDKMTLLSIKEAIDICTQTLANLNENIENFFTYTGTIDGLDYYITEIENSVNVLKTYESEFKKLAAQY